MLVPRAAGSRVLVDWALALFRRDFVSNCSNFTRNKRKLSPFELCSFLNDWPGEVERHLHHDSADAKAPKKAMRMSLDANMFSKALRLFSLSFLSFAFLSCLFLFFCFFFGGQAKRRFVGKFVPLSMFVSVSSADERPA